MRPGRLLIGMDHTDGGFIFIPTIYFGHGPCGCWDISILIGNLKLTILGFETLECMRKNGN